jgi:hypothetical protein
MPKAPTATSRPAAHPRTRPKETATPAGRRPPRRFTLAKSVDDAVGMLARPPDLLRSSSLRGGQLEGKRDAGTARAGERLHLVRDPPHYSQAVTRPFRKRIQQGRGIRGCDQVAIVDPAVQGPRQLPYSQSSLPAAMADHIGRQLVNGQDHIPGPVIRQSRLTGKSQHFGSQDIQRA